MNDFLDRMIRAARLDPELYEEVEADQATLGQSAAVVVLSSVAAGIGVTGVGGVGGLVMGSVAALLGWLVWASMIYLIGTKLLPEPQTESNIGELLRTLGFASAPGVLRVLGVVPGLGPVIVVLVTGWMLAAMVVAVRQALDYEGTVRAIAVCLIGFFIQALLLAWLMMI
jgi:hypothetical protein